MSEVMLPSRWSLLLRFVAGPTVAGLVAGSVAAFVVPTRTRPEVLTG
jgi:hypothetical protein